MYLSNIEVLWLNMNAYVILPSQSLINFCLVSKILQVSPQDIFTMIHKDSLFFFLQILIAGREVNSQQLSCFDVHFLSLMTAGKA